MRSECLFISLVSSIRRKTNPRFTKYVFNISLQDYQDAKTVTADGRNGDPSLDKAFNGSNGNTFYRTPATFFQDTSESNDSADTTAGARSALDQNGGMHSVVASGPRILLPDIPGVGVLRSRYPIMPTHAEGSATWKELDALKDLMLRPTKYREMSYNNQPKPEPGIQVIKTSLFTAADPHVHYLVLTKQNVRDMTDNPLVYNVTVETTAHEEDGHTHIFTVVRNKQGGYRYDWCDDKRTCKGGHSKWQMYCAPDPVCLPWDRPTDLVNPWDRPTDLVNPWDRPTDLVNPTITNVHKFQSENEQLFIKSYEKLKWEILTFK